MIILPAIDILKGSCVRLTEGVFDTSERVAEDYLETALTFKKAGAKWIHMVDLDGALKGKRVNDKIFIDVAEKIGLKVELGGGIRTMDDIRYYIDKGISRIVLGSVAIDNPSLVKEALTRYGSKIAVGIDAKDGKVKTSAWTKGSESDFIETAKIMENFGVELIIYTDISRDGTMAGPNLEQLEQLSNAVTCQVIASGGIRNLDDIKALKGMNLYGAICGKSIYQGSIDLEQAINVARLREG